MTVEPVFFAHELLCSVHPRVNKLHVPPVFGDIVDRVLITLRLQPVWIRLCHRIRSRKQDNDKSHTGEHGFVYGPDYGEPVAVCTMASFHIR